MKKKKINTLTKLNSKINSKIDSYLQKLSKKNFEFKKILEYREKCRYKHDDFRPLLVKLGYSLFSGKKEKDIFPAMVAIHLDLLSFIPLDDIIDYFSLKSFKQKEVAKSLYLTTIMRENVLKILRIYQKNKNYGEILDIISLINKTLDHSQVLETNNHKIISIENYKIENYIKLIDEATSVMIAGSILLGALIAGANEEEQRLVWDLGINIGRLGQIRDDFLDYIDPNITHKKPFSDLIEKKKRFPVLISYLIGNKEQKEDIKKILNKNIKTKENIKKILNLITSKETKEGSKKIIKIYYDKAIDKLKKLPQNNTTQTINKIINLFARI